MDLIYGLWRSQTLYAGVELGVFDAVGEEPTPASEIADELALDADQSYRLLRALGSLGLLDEHADRGFALTAEGTLLPTTPPRSAAWSKSSTRPTLPPRGTRFLISSEWARKILSTIHESAPEDARVLVIEPVISDPDSRESIGGTFQAACSTIEPGLFQDNDDPISPAV